jgi:hypothetical protein
VASVQRFFDTPEERTLVVVLENMEEQIVGDIDLNTTSMRAANGLSALAFGISPKTVPAGPKSYRE